MPLTGSAKLQEPMESELPQNPLHERYASSEMVALWTSNRRYARWRGLWVLLARAQRELGLPISEQQIEALEAARGSLDLARVAEIERATRHDVVAHLRHYAEQVGDAGGILHLGATSAFITDNADAAIVRDALELLGRRVAGVLRELRRFALEHQALPTLAYTHFQPAQLTTVGKRAMLWAQDLLTDLEELEHRLARLRCRGAKGTTGTQASFLTLFGGDGDKVESLDRKIAEGLGFPSSWPLTGQTYPRKQDSQVLAWLAGIGESCHKMGTDLRLLQGVGELAEPFDEHQVGSSAMAYKRNPVRAERMCALSRRLWTDSLNGPLNAGTQWLERSLDDSANRRLVLQDAFLTGDAVLSLAGGIVRGLRVQHDVIAARVARELPFMATETFLMEATLRGGDRQDLHERLRRHSLEAHAGVARGEENRLIAAIAADRSFGLTQGELAAMLDPQAFAGRSAQQVERYVEQVIDAALRRWQPASVEDPRI
jgi:adenylosuccinate lyase